LPAKNAANPEYSFADWTVGQNHKFADKARIDLPAMTQRVLDQQVEINRLMAIIGELAVNHETERDKLAEEVNELYNRLIAQVRDRNKLAGQVREAKELLQTAFDVLTVTEDECDKDWVARTERFLAETEQAG
jgi:hypothetical protein